MPWPGWAWLLRTYRLLPPPLRRGARGHLHPMDLVYVVLVVVGLLVPLVMLLTVLAWLGHVWLLRVLTYLELRLSWTGAAPLSRLDPGESPRSADPQGSAHSRHAA